MVVCIGSNGFQSFISINQDLQVWCCWSNWIHSHLQIVYISCYIRSDNRAFVKIRQCCKYFVCKIVHLYISSIMHAILSTGTLQEDIFLHWDLIVIVSDWNFKKHDRFLVYIQTQCLRNNHCLRHQILTAICLVWLSVLSQSWWEFFTRLLHMTSNNEKISQMCRSTHARSI